MTDDGLPIRDVNDEYILIQSEGDFKKPADPANGNYPLNEKYRLMADINPESVDWLISIGLIGTPFIGVFDGNNKTISNLELMDYELMDYKEDIGLVDDSAKVIPLLEPEFPTESGADSVPPVTEEAQLHDPISSGWLLAASFIVSGCMFLILLRKEKNEEN